MRPIMLTRAALFVPERADGGARRKRHVRGTQPSGSAYIGKRLCSFFDRQVVNGKIVDAKRDDKTSALSFHVIYDNGEMRMVPESETDQAILMYEQFCLPAAAQADATPPPS